MIVSLQTLCSYKAISWVIVFSTNLLLLRGKNGPLIGMHSGLNGG